jgi:nuclear pore complex protein Nup188
MQLVEARLENDLVLALVVFSLQYILVNHEYWKYKVKHVRWKVTLKVSVIFMPAAINWFP